MTDTITEPITQEELDGIIDALAHAGRKLPADAIQAARRCKDRIIPKLIEAIQRAIQAFKEDELDDDNAAFFALFLIAEFRAAEGLPAIIEAISLPKDGPFNLFGDAIHDVLPRVLVSLGQDRCIEICCELFRNSAINQFVRWSAGKAILYHLFAGLRPRAEIVQVCKTLLTEAIERKDEEAVSALVIELVDLNPWELSAEIKDAFDRGLVEEAMIDWGSVKEHLHDKPMEPSREFAGPPCVDDTIKELEHWASFQPEKPRRPIPAPVMASRAPAFERVQPILAATSRNPAVARVGRNDRCPCGSGQKFKRCCGRSKS